MVPLELTWKIKVEVDVMLLVKNGCVDTAESFSSQEISSVNSHPHLRSQESLDDRNTIAILMYRVQSFYFIWIP